MLVGMVITYVLTIFTSLDVTSDSGLLVASAVFFIYAGVDMILLHLCKLSPATVVFLAGSYPFVLLSKYLTAKYQGLFISRTLYCIEPPYVAAESRSRRNMIKRIAESVLVKTILKNISKNLYYYF